MTTLGTARAARTPSGMKVSPMSYAKLEEVADGIRPLLPKAEGLHGGKWKVDSWRVLEQTLTKANFNYCIADDEELDDCAAFTIPEHKLVVVRRDAYDGLFCEDPFSRSTVIHELAHIVLNHAVTLRRGATPGKHQFYEDSEWQAKALTAAIMMPVMACKAAHSPFELSELCGTSLQAATYRIERLIHDGRIDKKRHKGSLFENLDSTILKGGTQ